MNKSVIIHPISSVTSLTSHRHYRYGDKYFRASLFLCKRLNKTLISLKSYPFMNTPKNGCLYCKDNLICEFRSYRDMVDLNVGFQRNNDPRKKILLFDEEGITTEVIIGRFTFKIKEKNESN